MRHRSLFLGLLLATACVLSTPNVVTADLPMEVSVFNHTSFDAGLFVVRKDNGKTERQGIARHASLTRYRLSLPDGTRVNLVALVGTPLDARLSGEITMTPGIDIEWHIWSKDQPRPEQRTAQR